MPQILSTPGSYYSLHDDLIFTVIDWTKPYNPSTYPDYRYICDVYNNTELVARLKAYPRPDTKIGIFNVSNILRNYCTPAFNPTPDVFMCQNMTTGEFNVSGTCIFGEEYDFVQYLNVSGDTGRKYYNHYNGRKLGVQTNLQAYLGLPATRRPLKFKMYRSSEFHLIPFYKSSGDLNVDVQYYSSSGANVLGTANVISGFTDQMLMLNIANPGIEEFVGFPIPSTAVRMVLTIEDSIYNIDLVCEDKHDVYNLHFLNRFGGFETKDFTKLSRKTIDIEKAEYGRLPYTLSAAGVPQYYNSNRVYKEGRSVFSSQFKEKLTLNTDILSDDEFEWLHDLIVSPMVFIEFVSGGNVYHVPVVITDSNYEFKKSVNQKPNSLTINVEFGDQFNAQYR